MTHRQLIALLIVHLAIMALGSKCDRFFPLPESVRAISDPKATRVGWSKFRIIAYGVCGAVLLAAFVIGVVGMFLLWPPAPWLFTLALIGLSLPASPWTAMTGLNMMLSELQLFLGGFISALTLFGPARHLFE